MDTGHRERALQLLNDEQLSLHALWIWFEANGGNSDELSFEAALLCPDAWDEYTLTILGWAIADALA